MCRRVGKWVGIRFGMRVNIGYEGKDGGGGGGSIRCW